jgi:hypothetical protein
MCWRGKEWLVVRVEGPKVILGLSDEPGQSLEGDSWIGAFVALGSLLRGYLPRLESRQLVVALSVPRRDYCAALLGAGWMLSSAAPDLGEPIDVFRAAVPGVVLRAVTDKKIATGAFSRLVADRTAPRVITAGTQLLLDRYKAVAVIDGGCPAVFGDVPAPGFLAEFTGAAPTWLSRVAAPPMDLALVGTAKWLMEDLEACIGNAAPGGGDGTPLANYVLPISERAATWATEVIPASRLGEGVGIRADCTAAVLDGYGAIKYLNDLTTPILVCIIDRSVADDSAAELVAQARAANSRPVPVRGGLRWEPPAGVEVLAFTVAL